MHTAPTLLMIDPAHFDVSYVINPWMRPDAWAADPAGHRATAVRGSRALATALTAAGACVETMPGAPGQPDMVFPANAGIVLNRRALLARFRHPERRGEEMPFLHAFQALQARGLLDEVSMLPEGCFQEGAGDCIWDATRGFFWAGFGPRSCIEATGEVAAFFGQGVERLRLVSERFYHLDVCFCPLSGGEVLYYPPAFSLAAQGAIRSIVPPEKLIVAADEDAERFCVNAVNLGRTIVMAQPAPRLRAVLEERGYTVAGVDLAPFMMAGGGAYCMTLRLDRQSASASASATVAAPALA